MDYLYGFILGLIQGFGELMPISGSGHLLMAERLMELPQNPALESLLRIGTVAAVVIACYKTVWAVITGFFSMLAGLFKGTFKWRKANRYQIMSVYLIVATLPLLGAALIRKYYDYSAMLSDNLIFVGFMLLLSAGFLFIGDHSACRNWTVADMKPSHAMKLGLFQAFATLPGISRSGFTFSMGMNMGFEREAALEFSFMMSIPALLCTNLFEISEMGALGSAEIGMGAVALITAVLSGLGAIFLLKALVRKDRLGWLVVYCILAGIAAIVLNFIV